MSLHDVSKHDDTRLDPKANASDARAQRDATNTTSIHPVTDATTTKGFLKTGSGQVLGNDGTNNIGLFGFDSTGTMVVKVAKPGFDADTASNANLIFNSAQNVFKIALSGNTTVNIPSATSASVDVTHGLGTTPYAIASVSAPNAPTVYFNVPYTIFSAGAMVARVNVSTNSTTASFIVEVLSGASLFGNWTFKYYLLQETAN